jgi:hypothetical protein
MSIGSSYPDSPIHMEMAALFHSPMAMYSGTVKGERCEDQIQRLWSGLVAPTCWLEIMGVRISRGCDVRWVKDERDCLGGIRKRVEKVLHSYQHRSGSFLD